MKLQARQQRNITAMLTRIAVVALPVLLAIALAISSWAYGPERKTFTQEKPADYITFNSITNNENYGDERNFVIAKDAANTSAGGWSDEIKVEDGKEYIVRMYVHNNAAANLNLVAKNTRVMANVPNTSATSHQIDGFITADNANPSRIWDSVVLKGDQEFIVNFVGGSARYHNNVNPSEGFGLSDSIVTSAGVQVGYEKMDGNVPGCFEFSGIATFRIKVTTKKEANFELSKKVRQVGTEEWKDSIVAKLGDKLEYRLAYDNNGDRTQNNVILRDTPPAGIAYENGSSTLKNASNPQGNGKAIGNDSLVTEAGVNIGNYAPNSNAFVYYNATVNQEDLACGTNKLINTATASTDNGRKTDTAEVIVEVECAPDECKPGVPEGDERCAEVPAAPTTLPQTGPAEVILSLIGIAALAAGAAYWYKSRKDLKKALTEGSAALASDTAEDAPKLLKARTDSSAVEDKKEF